MSPTATGDDNSQVFTNSGHLLFAWIYNLLLETSLLPLTIRAGPAIVEAMD